MHYEHHINNVFSHRVILTPGEDDYLTIAIFDYRASDVNNWLRDNIGRGHRNAKLNNDWHAFSHNPINKSILFALGPFWISFRKEEDALLFRITWANYKNI